MKLNYITIMVRNIEKSIKFYQELTGLQIVRQMELPMGKIVFLSHDSDQTMIELIEFPNSDKVETKGLVISYLAESDLESIRQKALELGYEPSDIIANGQKPKHFTVSDPDGILVEFSN